MENRDFDSTSFRTVYEGVKDRILTAILTNRLPAGARLVQSELAEQFRVSITPVREALRELSAEGIVDFDSFRGAVVHTPSAQELEDVYEIRSQLVPLCVRRGVAGIQATDFERVEQLIELMGHARSQPAWVDLNRQFHHVLDEATRDPHLSVIMGRLADLSTLYVNVSVGVQETRRASAETEHRLLLDAYLRKDVDGAIEMTLRHFKGTMEAARTALVRSNNDYAVEVHAE